MPKVLDVKFQVYFIKIMIFEILCIKESTGQVRVKVVSSTVAVKTPYVVYLLSCGVALSNSLHKAN